jgi:3-oxoacyl-(acyl-carrier-protein) synthase
MPYINGIGIISPQNTVESQGFMNDVVSGATEYMKCIEPVYRNYIDPIQSRRMSRLIKMGITAARIGVAQSGVSMPDAIITGTGMGSVEDTEKILAEISREERFLNPTPFIQSTYNTISSQVAIQLKCHNYNSTYVHRAFSFESGLIDGLMQIEEGTAQNVLIGAIDEMTLNHLNITRRTGMWRREPVNNLEIFNPLKPGALAGEGAAFFMIGAHSSPSGYAVIRDVSTYININDSFDIGRSLLDFLKKNGLTPEKISLLVSGANGDSLNDPFYNNFITRFFPDTPTTRYKHFCGEFYTATGFGLWAAANMLKNQQYPEIFQERGTRPNPINNILIYNHFRNINHSFILLERC